MQNIDRTVAAFEGRLTSISNSIDGRDSTMATLKTRVRTAGSSIPAVNTRIAAAKHAIENISEVYLTAEKSGYENLSNSKVMAQAYIEVYNDPSDTRSVSFPSVREFLTGAKGIVITDGIAATTLQVGYKKYSNDLFKSDIGKETVKRDITGKDASYAKELGGVSLLELSYKKEKSLFDEKISGENYEVKVKAFTAEWHAKADVGMYKYDSDGNKFWSPRVAAEVGGSATALAISGSGKFMFSGKDTDSTLDDFGIQATGAITVGQVKGKAEVKTVLFDDEGNFKPEIKASVSAELIAFEAKGSAGVTIAGVEANVTGKVGVGLGAHADFGYTDGKLKVSVGAYLGVGGSVGFELDIGGAVDAVCTGAKALWDTIWPW